MNELVCVSDSMTSEEAHVAMLSLQEVDIPCFLADANCAELFSYALGGVKLMVPAADADRAVQALSATAAGRFTEEASSPSRSNRRLWTFLALIDVVVLLVGYLIACMIY